MSVSIQLIIHSNTVVVFIRSNHDVTSIITHDQISYAIVYLIYAENIFFFATTFCLFVFFFSCDAITTTRYSLARLLACIHHFWFKKRRKWKGCV